MARISGGLPSFGCGPRGENLGRKIRAKPELGYLLVGYLDDIPAPAHPNRPGPERLLGSLDSLESVLDTLQLDEIWVGLPIKSHYESIVQVIRFGEERGVIVRMPADLFQLRLASSFTDDFEGQSILTIQMATPSSIRRFAKRSLDVTLASAALILLAPVLALIALAVRLDTPGPVLFVQERVGWRRRRFRLFKFRTMVADAERRLADLEWRNDVEGAAFKMRHDPRVTRVGGMLRGLSLDELPQLWNVIAGDMSLVGPRPLPVRDVERFESRWQERRFSVKPGLTCIWQANGRHQIGFQDWMELDLQYVDNWSFRLDLELILKTVPAVLRGTGAN